MHRIDPNTGNVQLLDDRLPYVITGHGSVAVDGIWYNFGGRTLIEGNPYQVDTDNWMKYVARTSSPSEEPTKNPSRQPTKNPTEYPTKSPSRPPTNVPSHNPSHNPTSNPTEETTVAPSSDPTMNPLVADDVDAFVENTLVAEDLEVVLIETNINSDGTIVVLIAIKSGSNLSVESVRELVGEALEEEYGQGVEIEINVELEAQSEESVVVSLVSEYWLFIVIGVIFLCCTCIFIGMCITHKKNKSVIKKLTEENLRVTSMSTTVHAISSVSMCDDGDVEMTSGRGDNDTVAIQAEDETDEMYTVHANETPQRKESDNDDDMYDTHTHVKNISIQVEGGGGQSVTGHVVTKGQATKGQMTLMQELNGKLATRTSGYATSGDV